MRSTTMPVSDRDRRALLGGGAVIAVLLLYLLIRGGGSGPPPEPVVTEVQATLPAAPAPVAPASAPVVMVTPVVVTPAANLSQLRLVGIFSRGAVIAMADGTQRFVPVGREFLPGVTLRGVELHHAILATPSGEVRLGFDSAAPPQAASQPPR
jgi:hypothetical protein